MYLIHLTYQPSQLSLAYFTWLRPLTLDTVGQNHLTQSLFYNEVLTLSYNVLDTVLKVNNRKGGLGTERLLSTGVVCTPDPMTDWELQLLPRLNIARENHTTYYQLRRRSKFKDWFLLNAYCF